jgi:threonine aldolase
MINLVSDTVTKPTAAMLAAMMTAEVGDDVFGEDPTINALQQKVAALFGKEAALFCPSGTMCNQIALQVHTRPLEEVICHELSHIYRAETGGTAHQARLSMQLLKGENGKITAEQIQAAIQPDRDWLPRTSLIVLENTANIAGGAFYTKNEMAAVAKICTENGLKLHLDGARIFNALAETGDTPQEIGSLFDSISVCLSKGLGAPVGSLLVGSYSFIKEARRFRKVMGGGMRQAGFLAAAGIYALDNHVARLKTDHQHAQVLAQALAKLPFVENIRSVQTNIVIFDVKQPLSANDFLEKLQAKGIKASAFGVQTIRFVTHLDFTAAMLTQTLAVLGEF